jgi:hypothetical protein
MILELEKIWKRARPNRGTNRYYPEDTGKATRKMSGKAVSRSRIEPNTYRIGSLERYRYANLLSLSSRAPCRMQYNQII